jgi:hypothetical protein
MNKSTKGKQGTRGLKQVLIENKETIDFYFKVLSGSNSIYLIARYLLFWESFTSLYIVLFSLTTALSWFSWYFMKNMATPELDEMGVTIGAGSDLNMQGHISEYFKDIILFTVIVHALSLITDYFWLLLIVAPIYLFVLLWKNFLGPWFFAPAPEEDDTKQNDQKKVKEKKKIIRVR